MKTKSFSYNSLRSATGDFHPSCKIGGGGYGVVYKVRIINNAFLFFHLLFLSYCLVLPTWN